MAEAAAQNGHKSSNGKVRVAIVGVGNCASSLVQGIEYYRDADPRRDRPRPDARRPGRLPRLATSSSRPPSTSTSRRSARIWERPSSAARTTPSSSRDVPAPGRRGAARHDPRRPRQVPQQGHHQGPRRDRRRRRRSCARPRPTWSSRYLPVGSEEATKWYVEQVLAAGCGFVNCVPVFIAREPYWRRRFEQAGAADRRRRHQVAGRRDHRPPQARPPVPGARRAARAHPPAQRGRQHRLPEHARARAAGVQEDLQDQRRHLASSTTTSDADNVHIGPSDHVAWLHDRKWAYIRLEGRSFGDVPLNIELKLEVSDSPNSAGIVIDAVRCAKLGARQRPLGRARMARRRTS